MRGRKILLCMKKASQRVGRAVESEDSLTYTCRVFKAGFAGKRGNIAVSSTPRPHSRPPPRIEQTAPCSESRRATQRSVCSQSYRAASGSTDGAAVPPEPRTQWGGSENLDRGSPVTGPLISERSRRRGSCGASRVARVAGGCSTPRSALTGPSTAVRGTSCLRSRLTA